MCAERKEGKKGHMSNKHTHLNTDTSFVDDGLALSRKNKFSIQILLAQRCNVHFPDKVGGADKKEPEQ